MTNPEVTNREAPPCFDCNGDAPSRLKEMFVDVVQQHRIDAGQEPVRRPVFLKPHGIAHAEWTPRADLPPDMRVGVFGMGSLRAWLRFSSDTLPSTADLRTTCGLGIKLFGVPGEKLIDDGDTHDFLLQNHDVFFVDTAADMCEFTRAGVIDGDYEPYLQTHPETRRILDEMAKVEPSSLTATYWGVLPYAFGENRFVKYKLEPVAVPDGPPPDGPDYLAADLARRLRNGDARFRFFVQFRDGDMPLDCATVEWSEEESEPIHVADLVLPRQDVDARGQAEYGEQLAFNPWHTLSEHRPLGSISDARRDVYAASSDRRRTDNGVMVAEPGPARIASTEPSEGEDSDGCIVRAVIHPSIGVARVGNSRDEWFLGPEVIDPPAAEPGFHRDASGALKRQAARFRVYGVDARGRIVRELTAHDAEIEWTVHLANQKSAWYEFQLALDIPEASSAPPSLLRNATVADRSGLVIDPGPRSIHGTNTPGDGHRFDTGRFLSTPVYLGELRTDDDGRLIVLGGRGVSSSADGSRAVTFANNDGWHDDVADGPVTARVRHDGVDLEVVPAWVIVAPPNYAPRQKSVRTMWDLMRDVAIAAGQLPKPTRPSFRRDIRPIFERMSNLQWVNAGFAAAFGWQGPFELSSPVMLERLNDDRASANEFRKVIANAFRRGDVDSWSPKPWPWLYGDAMNIPPAETPRQNATLSETQLDMLDQWAAGDFDRDDQVGQIGPDRIEDVPMIEQGATLDRAALDQCLADAFHPGCEMTWPMRHTTMYMSAFRVAHADLSVPPPTFGAALDQSVLSLPEGPLAAQRPGGLTRWMAVPWQTDTASCRSGYQKNYDPFVPTFWPARVPNEVLSEDHYDIVMDRSRPLEDRLAAFNSRAAWIRPLGSKSYTDQINNMIARFGELGVVEERDGPGDEAFPATMQVEQIAEASLQGVRSESTSGQGSHATIGHHEIDGVDLTAIDKVNRFPGGLRT